MNYNVLTIIQISGSVYQQKRLERRTYKLESKLNISLVVIFVHASVYVLISGQLRTLCYTDLYDIGFCQGLKTHRNQQEAQCHPNRWLSMLSARATQMNTTLSNLSWKFSDRCAPCYFPSGLRNMPLPILCVNVRQIITKIIKRLFGAINFIRFTGQVAILSKQQFVTTEFLGNMKRKFLCGNNACTYVSYRCIVHAQKDD